MNNRFLYRISAGLVSLTLAASMSITAGAWSEDPGEAEATTTAADTTPADTTAPSLGGDLWETEETTTTTAATTTTEEPDAVLEDDLVAEEEDEDIGEEIVEPEETEAPETAAPETQAPETTAPETTAATTTAAAPANTAAPDSYQAVDPFKMYVPEVLNVRGGPGTEYDKLGQVYANNTISIYGISGDWYVFDYYGLDGYLLSSLLAEVPADTQQTTTTTQAPETDTTQPPVDDDWVDDDWDDDATIDDDGGYIEEVTTPEETDAPETPANTTTTNETPDVMLPTDGDMHDGSDGNGFPPVILALICAVAAFVLIGVVPVLIHKSHHKKLYQY